MGVQLGRQFDIDSGTLLEEVQPQNFHHGFLALLFSACSERSWRLSLVVVASAATSSTGDDGSFWGVFCGVSVMPRFYA